MCVQIFLMVNIDVPASVGTPIDKQFLSITEKKIWNLNPTLHDYLPHFSLSKDK